MIQEYQIHEMMKDINKKHESHKDVTSPPEISLDKLYLEIVKEYESFSSNPYKDPMEFLCRMSIYTDLRNMLDLDFTFGMTNDTLYTIANFLGRVERSTPKTDDWEYKYYIAESTKLLFAIKSMWADQQGNRCSKEVYHHFYDEAPKFIIYYITNYQTNKTLDTSRGLFGNAK